jgi:SET domain
MLTYAEAQHIREGPMGHVLGSHFATPACRSMVINGYTLSQDSNTEQGGVKMSRDALQGYGGGSFCNFSSDPNAKLVRDNSASETDGYGIFVVSVRDIQAGEFITVDYGSTFLSSNKSNLIYFHLLHIAKYQPPIHMMGAPYHKA